MIDKFHTARRMYTTVEIGATNKLIVSLTDEELNILKKINRPDLIEVINNEIKFRENESKNKKTK